MCFYPVSWTPRIDKYKVVLFFFLTGGTLNSLEERCYIVKSYY